MSEIIQTVSEQRKKSCETLITLFLSDDSIQQLRFISDVTLQLKIADVISEYLAGKIRAFYVGSDSQGPQHTKDDFTADEQPVVEGAVPI